MGISMIMGRFTNSYRCAIKI